MEKDHRYLATRLAERNANPNRAIEIDQEIWNELGKEVAILVSDTSGFTRITKERGILHFLALVQKGVELSRPIIKYEGGILLKQEADNMLCAFPSPDHALRAAVSIVQTLRKQNESVSERDSHIEFSLGIGYGRILCMTDEVFGDEVNVASKLGEDTANGGEILLSKAAAEALTSPHEECILGEWETINTSNVALRYRKASLRD